MPDTRSQPDEWPNRDHVSDEDGPDASRDVPRDRAQNAPRGKNNSASQDVDPDSAESQVDRDDSVGDS